MEHCYKYGRPPDGHPSYVHLTAKNKDALEKLKVKLHEAGIPTAEFHEPYQNWGLTSISCCIPEEHRALLKSYQLWRLPTQGD